jgi:NitT/TauT family transport system permease protein
VSVFEVKSFIAPSPAAVVNAMWENRALLWRNLVPTATEAIAGFFLGNTAAILFATMFVHSPVLRRMYFPVAVILNTIPIIALSPVLIILFGLTITAKIFISALVCFFPMLVNMIRGFESASASEFELMKVLSASRTEIFFRLRFPRSVPFLFSGLRIACTACVIGAIVSEWIGSEMGIGVLILQSSFDYRTELLYAAIATSSALALSLFAIVVALESRYVRWHTT